MANKIISSIFAISTALIITLVESGSVGAQASLRANIDSINDQQFPLVEAYVSLSDAQGQPIGGLTADDFSIFEDSLPIQPLEISEIENTKQPLSIALVMDTSGSMGSAQPPSPLSKAVEAAKTFSDQLTPQDQIAVIKFADTPTTVQQLTTDKNAVKSALDGLSPEGNYTTLYDAIVEAVNILKSYSGRRIIVLITDGEDTGTGVFDFDQAVHEASGASIPIYPLGFGNRINQDELTRMAILTGGLTQLQPSASDLQTSFSTVLRVLREQYFIRYLSTFPADERQHTFMVTASYQGAQLDASRFFTARSSQIPVTLPDYQANQVVGGIEHFLPTTDWPAPIEKLDITVDGILLATVQDEPYSYEWDSTKTENDIQIGTHEFKFTFTDIAGNTGQASIILDVQPPLTVHITHPSDGDTVNGSSLIAVEVMPLSDIQLGSVEIAVEGQIIGNPITSPPYETDWDLTNVPAGKHTITVIGYDATGQFSSKDEINVNVAVGTYSWMIALIVILAIAVLIIPIAVRKRRRLGKVTSPSVKSGEASLREIKGMNPNRDWPLGVNELRLGRKSDENDIPLDGRNASRKHAVIRYEKGQYVIYGLNTENPVIINGIPVVQAHVLQQGDEIQLGETVLKYEQSEQNNI